MKDKFHALFPDAFFLTDDIAELTAYLGSNSFLVQGETILHAEKPGEGNMNYVLRVISDQRSFIMKQARPWVEKYPQIDAPVIRNSIEARYYQSLNKNPITANYSPDLLLLDENNFILIMSDLGSGSDFMHLYDQGTLLLSKEISILKDYLVQLHLSEPVDFPDNLEMRTLNHAHIFHLPFVNENGFELDNIQPGLQALSKKYKHNPVLVKSVQELGLKYLEKGDTLVHGDFYPASWISTDAGIKIIDPEFCFPGFPEFDVGVMLGHLTLSDQPVEIGAKFLSAYQEVRPLNPNLTKSIAGVEIMRRLIGIAQLPLDYNLDLKESMMDQAVKWILN